MYCDWIIHNSSLTTPFQLHDYCNVVSVGKIIKEDEICGECIMDGRDEKW